MKTSTRTAAALPLVLWLAFAGIANASGPGTSGENHGTGQQTEAIGYGALDSGTQEAIDGLRKALEGAYPADVADEIAGLVSEAIAGGTDKLGEYHDKIAGLIPGGGATDALDNLFGKLDSGNLGGLSDAVGNFGNAAAQAAGDLGKGLGNALDSKTQEAIDGLQKALEGAYPADVADEIAGLVSDAIAGGADKLDEYRDKIAGLIPGDGAADALDKLIGKLGSGNLDGLADAVENFGNAAAQAAGDLGKGLGNALDAKTQEAIDGLQKALEGAYPADVAEEIAGLVSDAIAGGADKLDEYRDKLADLLPGEGAADALDKLVDKLGSGNLDGLADAVENFGNAAAQAANDLGKALDSGTQAVIDELQAALEGAYPADVAEEIAGLVSDAIAGGADKLDEYRDKLADLLPGESAVDALDKLIDKLGSGDLGGLADVVEKFGEAAAQAAGDLGKGLSDALDAGAQAVIDEIRDALGWSLPSDVADEIAGLIADAIEGGKDKLDEYREKLGDLLPGDSAKDALDALFDQLGGDLGGLADAVADLGKKAAVDYLTGVLVDLGVADGLPLEDIEKAVEALVDNAYDAGKSIVDALQQAVEEGLFGEGGLADILDKLGIDLSQISVDGLIDALEDAVSGAWDTITTVGLQKLEEFAADQLDKWISSNPAIQEVFKSLEIDGESIIKGLKEIGGILSDNGSLEETFGQLVSWAQNKLCNMAQSALKYGLDKLASWLSDIAHKWVSKAVDWLMGKFAELFGVTVPTDAIQAFQAKLDQLAGQGIKKAMDYAQGAGTSIINEFRPKDGSQGNGGGSKSVWQAGKP